MFKKIHYRKPRICKDLLFQSLRYTKSKYLFFEIHSDLLKIDQRVDRVLNGRAQFGWTLTESHTTIQIDKLWGVFEYKLCDQIHRNKDQPAMIWLDGTLEWWKHGLRHRERDQPAVIYARANKTRKWYKHGKLHREGEQPAVIWQGGHREWWIDGKRIE